ncbi:MAG: para-nitrobenzyl esterase [Actinomycetota bacterium]|jgi:para-nitrobenzyl esterase|nr:para-nitrobenzyl esterase [Actinomycetota bacterium]
MATIVDTASGKLEGGPGRLPGVVAFKGIPYAQPPVGKLRFRAPEPPLPWAGVRPALEYGKSAPQPEGAGTMPGIPFAEQDEDCLTLNVWTPAADDGKRPVMVWIHGGAYVTGAGSQKWYDGSLLAQRGDVVVVTINYRLGALGFLPLHRVGVEADANVGLVDQVAALRWVAANISAFGGDADNVTIFGESAGAMSIGTQLGVPASDGLFHRAILQSGTGVYVSDAERATRTAEHFLGEVGLTRADAHKVRDLPMAALVAATTRTQDALRKKLSRLPFQPEIDGDVLPAPPLDRVVGGASGDVDILVGTNLDEGNTFNLGDPTFRQLDDAGLVQRWEQSYPGQAQRLVDALRDARSARGDGVSPQDLGNSMFADVAFRQPAIELAAAHAAAAASATFMYLFTWPSPMLEGLLGSCHVVEIPFVFGSLTEPRAAMFVGDGPEARALATAVQDAWLSFARTGRPAAPTLPDWPTYDSGRRATMVLGAECRVEDDPQQAERLAWETVGQDARK